MSQIMTEALFVYGTLQDPTIQVSLLERTIAGISDVLIGYHINHFLMPPYPVAMPHPEGRIEGQVLQVTPDDLLILDEYEGECYLRITVTLASEQQAWVYIGNPACYPDVNSRL